MTEIVAHYLRSFRDGNQEEAFHGLLGAGHDELPNLIATCRSETDAEVRAFLVELIWQHRQPSVIPFLGEALSDPDPRVWKEAMNGLVALASPAALEALLAARGRTFSSQQEGEKFQGWLAEAIEQTKQAGEAM